MKLATLTAIPAALLCGALLLGNMTPAQAQATTGATTMQDGGQHKTTTHKAKAHKKKAHKKKTHKSKKHAAPATTAQ